VPLDASHDDVEFFSEDPRRGSGQHRAAILSDEMPMLWINVSRSPIDGAILRGAVPHEIPQRFVKSKEKGLV